ncbi:MAG: GMC family oxidoreductase N-terminal domain-containing protein, partial [Oligoflexus sp.]
MVLTDVFAEGMQREGWQLIDGARLEKDLRLEADAVIIGTGAGGGVAADMLSQAGRSVILVEEGVLATSKDFQLREAESYSRFYQEGMTRTTQDGAISILQGRAVGGSTTVNWTSSFRTPEPTLRHWASDGDVTGLDIETLAPWFERMEQRLSIFPWELANPNNDILRRGCAALGWAHGAIPRNVKACWNLGVCGLGCPTNA